MHRPTIITVLSAAALTLAGCGSTVNGTASGDPLATTKAPPPSHSSAAPPSPSTGSGTGDDGALTPTGTTLTVGQTATVKYAVKDLSKETTRLNVTAVSVKKGAIKDLKDFNLDAQTKVSDPFYITMTFRNAGPREMEPGGIFGLVRAHNTAGDELNRLSLIGTFKPCDGDVPKTLAVGASYTECEVYIAPAGQEIGNVNFWFYLEDQRTEITWKP